MNYQLPSFLLF